MLYADAFFTSRGETTKISDFSEKMDFTDPHATNGWGVVVVRGDKMWHFNGVVPQSIFDIIKKKKTYIFLLEVIAQCMGVWFMAPELGPNCWAFVDNVGAELALRKGFSRGRDANAVISLFWSSAAYTDVRPWFERVPSKAQLADGVSRGDDEMLRKMGSQHLDFDYKQIWRNISDIILRGGLASHASCSELIDTVSSQRERLGLPSSTAMAIGTRVGKRLRWERGPRFLG